MANRLLIAAAGSLMLLANASAFAWSGGHFNAYTPRGEFSGGHAMSCGGGSCSHEPSRSAR